MIDISQLTSLISAFRVETEKESISPETVGSLLQAIADLLATATSETEYNVLRFWKDTISQFQFLYDIQQRNVGDHSNVILVMVLCITNGINSEAPRAGNTGKRGFDWKRDPVGTFVRYFKSRYDTLKDCSFVIYERLPSQIIRRKSLL